MHDPHECPCQLCGHRPLTRFEIPQQTVFWKCDSCGLYQYGLASSDSTVNNPHYHSSYQRQRQRKVRTAMVRLNRIAKLCSVKAPRILDVGCGIGAVLEAATQRGWTAVGSDISSAVVEACRQSGFEAGLIENGRLPFEDESFDVVTSWSVIEHVDDVRQTLSEWRRVIRPGGILAMDTSTSLCWKARWLGARYRGFWPHGHTYTFSEPTLARFLSETGFEVLRRPFFGSFSEVSFSQAAYSVGYQLQYEMRQRLRLQKPFMIFAARVETAARTRKKVA